MRYKLFAFDLDGTLLDDNKLLSPANTQALHEMAAQGGAIAFATGRLASSMEKYVPDTLDDVAMLTLNGADVRMGKSHGSRRVHYAPLGSGAADHLIEYGLAGEFAVNYYLDGNLYAVRNERSAPWIDLYIRQTGAPYRFVPSLDMFRGSSPSKIIFVGAPATLDKQEKHFKEQWGESVYICRTWDYYLEFLDTQANKGCGLAALASAYKIAPHEVVAFGDAENDIPMLRQAGLGIAMANAGQEVKRAAGRVSQWTNNEDGVAREWELLCRKAE